MLEKVCSKNLGRDREEIEKVFRHVGFVILSGIQVEIASRLVEQQM